MNRLALVLVLSLVLLTGGAYAQTSPPAPNMPGGAKIPRPLFRGKPQYWQFDSYILGHSNEEERESGSILMPNSLTDGSNGYYLYYTASNPGSDEIHVAHSTDGESWTLLGTAIAGANDPEDPEYIFGGASVVKLSDGRARMYYRCSVKTERGTPPLYTVRSAISSDLVNFTRESGVRINIKQYDSSSRLGLAGHGSFYQLNDGTFAAIFSGNAYGEERQPSSLYLATSSDGLSWGNFKKLYGAWHDPVVKKIGNSYVLYAYYLNKAYGMATSRDGTTWPRALTRVYLLDEDGEPLSDRSGAGDFGLMVKSDGTPALLANFGNPSVDIVSFIRVR